MISPLLSKLSESEQVKYLSNEKRIHEVEQAVLSCSEVLVDLEAKLKEAKQRVGEKAQDLHALYTERQVLYDAVFKNMHIVSPKPSKLIHGFKKDSVMSSPMFKNKVVGSKSFISWLAYEFPVFSVSENEMKEVSRETAVKYWSENYHNLIRS